MSSEIILPQHILVAEYLDRERQFTGNTLKQFQRIIEESRDEPRKGLVAIRGYVSAPAFRDQDSAFQFFENRDFPLRRMTVPNCVVLMADVLGEKLFKRLEMALFTRGRSIALPERVLISLNSQRLERIQAKQQSS